MANLLRRLPPVPGFPEPVVKVLRQVDEWLASGQPEPAMAAMTKLLGAIYPQPDGPADIGAAIYFADCLDAVMGHLPLGATDNAACQCSPRTVVVIGNAATDRSAAIGDALTRAGWRVVSHEDADGQTQPALVIAFGGLRDPDAATLLRARIAPVQVAMTDHEPCVLPTVDRIATLFAPPEVWRVRLAGRGVALDDATDPGRFVAELDRALAA